MIECDCQTLSPPEEISQSFDLKFEMRREPLVIRFALIVLLGLVLCGAPAGQEAQPSPNQEFGPVVRAYLGYLDGEQEVVDDRASRNEISAQYYRRNSNRIRALRQIAVSIARETSNDFLPELEAAARDELKTLFDKPPNPRRFRVGQVLNKMYRYLGTVRAGEVFYVFARLDPYEQAELTEKNKRHSPTGETQPGPAVPVVSSDRAKDEPTHDRTGSP